MMVEKIVNYYLRNEIDINTLFNDIYNMFINGKITFDEVIEISRILNYEIDGSMYLMGLINN